MNTTRRSTIKAADVRRLLDFVDIPVLHPPAPGGGSYADTWVIPCPSCGQSSQMMLTDEWEGEPTIWCLGCGGGRWQRYSVLDLIKRWSKPEAKR